ncbi:hypothetical protein Hanom_Chr05g00461391 [Helianthus anomalus]
MISMICLLGLKLKHSYLLALLYLHGNMFVKIISSIQYQVIKQSVDDAFYELQNKFNLIFFMVMVEYGCTIKHTLMVDIIPDPSVRGTMNEINAGNCLFCLSEQQLLCFQTSRGYII